MSKYIRYNGQLYKAMDAFMPLNAQDVTKIKQACALVGKGHFGDKDGLWAKATCKAVKVENKNGERSNRRFTLRVKASKSVAPQVEGRILSKAPTAGIKVSTSSDGVVQVVGIESAYDSVMAELKKLGLFTANMSITWAKGVAGGTDSYGAIIQLSFDPSKFVRTLSEQGKAVVKNRNWKKDEKEVIDMLADYIYRDVGLTRGMIVKDYGSKTLKIPAGYL